MLAKSSKVMMLKRSKLLSLGVLISGRGSNLMAIQQHIKDGKLNAHIAIVIANRPAAPGLAWAKQAQLPCIELDTKQFANKAAYEAKLSEALELAEIDLVVLAGYMAILGKAFVQKFRGRIINIHPSLLPDFKGLHAQKQALDAGAKIAGCTVHYVDDGVDTGEIILQRTVPVLADDTEETLSERILKEEHQAYAQAIQLLIEK